MWGANRDSIDREGGLAADFAAVIARLAPVVDYAAVNVSSPNTPGLRDLQRAEALHAIVESAVAAGAGLPILVKLAPDLDDAGFEAVLEVARTSAVAGLVLSNTTLARDGLRSTAKPASRAACPARRSSPARPASSPGRGWRSGPGAVLVGVGGVDSPEAAIAKIEAGADLVQLYDRPRLRGSRPSRPTSSGD